MLNKLHGSAFDDYIQLRSHEERTQKKKKKKRVYSSYTLVVELHL